jgi:membrane-anchored protein YejM (alkaline phosphatase superfamily)
MNRRKFALSWGRKLFFGLSWPLTAILSLVYLRSSILPETTTDWIFFATSYIGHFGLLNAIAYFIFYVPVVALMPSYYVSRFFSLILILSLNLFILIDALSFSGYHQHIYGFLSELILEQGPQYLLGSSGLVILSVGLFIFAILIWLRGEMVWRKMQTRFSNPVKNWYLVFILICLIVSKSIFYYGAIDPRLADVFPLDQHLTKTQTVVYDDHRKFYYPVDDTNCVSKQSPNIVFIVIKEWNKDQLSAEAMPLVFHMKKHTMSFNSHYNVAMDKEGGLFSLLYSVPSSYMTAARKVQPALYSELTKRAYETIQIPSEPSDLSPFDKDERSMTDFRNWIANRTGEVIQPYFLSLTFEQHASDVDKYIQEIVLALEKDKLLSGSHILITGAYSGNNQTFIPLLYASPDRVVGEVNTVTSVYDVVPTLMQKAWNCKKIFKAASVGQSMDLPTRDWLLVTGEEEFKIIDFKNKNVIAVRDRQIIDSPLNGEAQGEPRHELIFSALRMMTTFSKFK